MTYDDEHLPVQTHTRVNTETGEATQETVATLKKEDLTKFIKDLRRYFDYHFQHKNIRFYACGEYGEKNQRPHFHVILFNLPLADIFPVDTSPTGYQLFDSPLISQIWKQGLIRLGEFNFDTAAYTARYVIKKHKGADKSYYEERGIVPEFVQMSRNPGIGRDWFDKHNQDIYKQDRLTIANRDGTPLKIKPP